MISETAADYYHSRTPSVAREVIRASQISGIEDNSVLAQFTGHLHADVNLYENFIDLFGVKFASPSQLRTLILQILSGGQYERGRAQDLQNPVSPQKCRHPGTRRRGQYRLGKLCAAFGPRKNGQRSQCKLDSPPGDRSRQPIDGRLAVVPAAGEDDRRFYADQIRLLEDDRFPGQPRGNLFRRKVRHADPQTGSGYVSQRDPLGRCHFGQAGRMGLAASLHPHPKGKGHLSNGRFDPAGPLYKTYTPSQYYHRRLLQHQIRRHRSLLQSNQLQPTGGRPFPDRRTHDQRVQPPRTALDLPGLRHPRRGLQGSCGGRVDAAPTTAAQTDGHLPQRRDTAQLGCQRPLGKQHPKLDLLPEAAPRGFRLSRKGSPSTNTSGCTGSAVRSSCGAVTSPRTATYR